MARKSTTIRGATKRCARCRRYKAFAEFTKANNRSKNGSHGLQAYCHPCGAIKNAAWRKANRPRKNPKLSVEEIRTRRRARQADYRKRNPKKIRMWNKLRLHRQRGGGPMPEPIILSAMLCEQEGLCIYCGNELGTNFHIDHKTPVSRGGGNEESNLQLLCRRCNIDKRARTHQEYLDLLAKRRGSLTSDQMQANRALHGHFGAGHS